MEPSIRDASLRAQGLERFNTPVRIHLHSRRHRLADTIEGCCYKYVIDGIVHAGLLQDDSSQEIVSATFTQEKISKEFEEDTIITIEEV